MQETLADFFFFYQLHHGGLFLTFATHICGSRFIISILKKKASFAPGDTLKRQISLLNSSK